MKSIKFAVAFFFAVATFNVAAVELSEIQDVASKVVSCTKTVVSNGSTKIEYIERIVEQTYDVNMTKMLQQLELVGVSRDSLEWKYLVAKHALVNSYKGVKNGVKNKFANSGDAPVFDCE